jgi:hypothetical protein
LQTFFVGRRLFFCVGSGLRFPFRDTRNFAEKGVSLHGTSAEWQFPVRDTGNFAENGVSLRGTAADRQFPVRDTWNFAEKGVSLHRASVFSCIQLSRYRFFLFKGCVVASYFCFPVSGCRDTGFSS